MSTRDEHDRLTDQQRAVLEGAGRTESSLEKLPLDWIDPERSGSWYPTDAYAECVRRLQLTMAEKE